MQYIKYSIPDLNIQFECAARWRHEIEEDGTYLFYDELLGSLRITAISIEDNNEIKINTFLNEEFDNNKRLNPEWIILGSFRFVHFKEKSKTDNTTLIHYYISGNDSFLLICSFSYDVSLDKSKEISDELRNVIHTLSSIKLE